MSNQQNPTNDHSHNANATPDSDITDEQLDQVAGGKVDMVEPTAVELPQGGAQSATPGGALSQGLNIKKPGGFLPLA